MSAIEEKYLVGGQAIDSAGGVLIMIHGRGSNASDIMELCGELEIEGMAIFAPQAPQNSWYPYSFMAPTATNQPAIDLSLSIVDELVKHVVNHGITWERIFFLGFSQGACLMLEYISRNAKKYGGAIAFTGGLIGEVLEGDNYKGDLSGTRILITTGDLDPHVPLIRVKESVTQLKIQQANVRLEVYKGKSHGILMDEINIANNWIFNR
ncbi:alpha/beta hydrolase [Pedobacter kyonggii]|uniref:Phospholipase n=1 Tax=Pedobacter kyonggii TaxID=1926871 RepID=A0A4Q9HII4_9SPHI|nr:dienelactone hydrolase family protein [Pedobacter kyonggii]TBO44520.1 phospholipase [Pedobacter kyonggii]